ncbi:hypothetical protein M885DRAFT_504552 [Pelagophyceae sp. CCMP2097]|nr:hypothetical protein M885DRAFT_504552 [Pelagophyceae sp. CCMP2097]|mmetsp:Transcript_5992/g.19103  ORF Transcript_5992/g.19103 Transcript_5992/m.19103 type:complete len:757 (-) Transcript_5992:255-2525(-)
MRFQMEELDVFFPYDALYPEQFSYMVALKQCLDAKGHGLLEMPTGTGKTACLLALISAYQRAHPETGKLVYCTRTVPEMEKCLGELKGLVEYRAQVLGEADSDLLALCLSSRRNMCIHERVTAEADRERVDVECRKMTASWVRARAASGAGDVETCKYYEEWDRAGTDAPLLRGVYDVDDLKAVGRERGWCPYFVARHAITRANIVVYNYQYMLDPKIAKMVTAELEAESVVVFDEGHNIDSICIEALSVEVDGRTLDAAQRCVAKLGRRVDDVRESDAGRVRDEYERLVQGLADTGAVSLTDDLLANPLLPADVLNEAVPGNVRRAEHFLRLLRVVMQHLRRRLGAKQVQVETPAAFLLSLEQATSLDALPLKFFQSRLSQLMRTVEAANLDDFSALGQVATFATLVATYADGFAVVVDPLYRSATGVPEAKLQLACLDASLAIKHVFEKFQSVIITSGTLSPIDLYPKLLDFRPVVRVSLQMSIFRPCILPIVITKGPDQLAISTRFESRDDPSVVRNYGALLVDICATVPDGIVAFFTSYQYMESTIAKWDELGVLRQILRHKLIFVETRDVVETTLALENYRSACDRGRGALFLSIARGKVAEGIDFDRQYGRCVVNLGVPYQYTQSHVLRARLEYLLTRFQIREADFLTFDAMRQTAQCVGRVVRSKTDYGIVILADVRFARHDKRGKLPAWVLQFLDEQNVALSTDSALHVMRKWLRQMAQPIDHRDLQQMLLDTDQVEARLKRPKFEAH